ncbi:MAG: hypothetical protein ABEJ99_05320 [Candidatus Nanohaloarchaea archaeon]
MAKKTTSIRIDKEIWKEAKKQCIDEEIELSEYISKLIKEDLGLKL